MHLANWNWRVNHLWDDVTIFVLTSEIVLLILSKKIIGVFYNTTSYFANVYEEVTKAGLIDYNRVAQYVKSTLICIKAFCEN